MKARGIIKRLQLLSLSLESAILSDELDSINPILEERAEMIERLEETELDSNLFESFAELQKIDDRVALSLLAARAGIADQVRTASGRKTSVRSYSVNREATFAEQAG